MLNLLKSLNENINRQIEEEIEILEFVMEMDDQEDKRLLRVDEIFGGSKKRKEEEALERRKRVMARGKMGSVEKNKQGAWSGGVMGEGRLAELVKQFGPPTFDNGRPPRKPEGMSPEDYKIWIEGFAKQNKEVDLGPSVGPAIGDIIRKNGTLYQVISSKDLFSIAKDKEGNKIRVGWDSLGKPQTKNDITLFSAD